MAGHGKGRPLRTNLVQEEVGNKPAALAIFLAPYHPVHLQANFQYFSGTATGQVRVPVRASSTSTYISHTGSSIMFSPPTPNQTSILNIVCCLYLGLETNVYTLFFVVHLILHIWSKETEQPQGL